MRLLLSLLSLVALSLVFSSLPAQAGEPASLKDLEKRLIDATEQLEALAKEAKRDPRERLLQQYLNYSRKDMNNRKREVRASMIVEWMQDASKPGNFEFRMACKDALAKGSQFLSDPDLSASKKKGSGTNRGYFFKQNVVPLLKKDDRDTRTLAARLLRDVYGRVTSVPEIFNYDVDKGKTWNPAAKAWGKHLRKK